MNTSFHCCVISVRFSHTHSEYSNMEEHSHAKRCLTRENITRLEESVLCITVIHVLCVLHGTASNDTKSSEMVLYYKCSTPIHDALNVVGVDCACVEIFTTMFIMPVSFLLCNSLFQVKFSFHDFHEKMLDVDSRFDSIWVYVRARGSPRFLSRLCILVWKSF